MATIITVLRGPALSSTFKSNSSCIPENTVYERDALIILENDKITEFGPAENLSKKIPQGTHIKTHSNCRFIKTVINS